jgi:hypothetical protein
MLNGSSGDAALTSAAAACCCELLGASAAAKAGSLAFRLLPVSPATQNAILKTPKTPIAAIATAPIAAGERGAWQVYQEDWQTRGQMDETQAVCNF